MAKIKVRKYQGCSNIDISKAILNLSENLLNSCGNNKELMELVISLAITGWNLSLYSSEGKDYSKAINKKLPKGLSQEYNNIFKNFISGFIKEKQEKYPGLLKGVTSHKFKIGEKGPELVVHALPINPV